MVPVSQVGSPTESGSLSAYSSILTFGRGTSGFSPFALSAQLFKTEDLFCSYFCCQALVAVGLFGPLRG